MNTNEMLKNIGERTNGDVYLGIVGPVRVGKSTFIKKFMELAVLSNIVDEAEKKRAIDELPQSGEGKMIMTAEPKFVPNNAAKVQLENEFEVKVRLVDCVGYVINGAKGYQDEQGIRMVRTPWFSEAIPFDEAAKIGTQKVIQDHSTIGIVVTTDGTIADIERPNYIQAENEVIEELKRIGKPFIVIVNSRTPSSPQAIAITEEIRGKYSVPTMALSVEHMSENDVSEILKEALYEFPVSEIEVNMPKWVAVLDHDHWLKKEFDQAVQNSLKAVEKLRDVEGITDYIEECEYIEKAVLKSIDTGKGNAIIDIEIPTGLYNEVLKDIIGVDIADKADLISLMQSLAKAKKEYDAISSALKMVKQTGYGFASPILSDIVLETPEVVKQGQRYGVKLNAKAPSIHMIRVDVETSFEPIIGSKQQSEELVKYLLRDHAIDPSEIWKSDIFGRQLSDIIKDGINVKLSVIPENARVRIQDILYKLVNKGKGNVIAIVL